MILLLWIALRGHCPVAEESVGDGSLLPRQTLLRDQVEVEGLFGQCRIVANCPVQELVMWIIRISLQAHTESNYSSSPKCLRAKKVCINQRRGGKKSTLVQFKRIRREVADRWCDPMNTWIFRTLCFFSLIMWRILAVRFLFTSLISPVVSGISSRFATATVIMGKLVHNNAKWW